MKKKNVLLLCILMIGSMVLSACKAVSEQVDSNASNASDSPGNTSLSMVNKLLVGSLKLEDTDQAITSEQAIKLLSLWQAYRSLSNSQTSAEAEVDALLNQIQSTMSSDQVKAIDEMNLTNTDVQNLMQSLGGGPMARGTPNPQGTPGFDFPSGGFEGDNGPSFEFQNGSGGTRGDSSGGTARNFPPGGGAVIIGGGPGGDAGAAIMGGGPTMQGTLDPSMQATAQARFSTMANRVNTILLDVLISKLEAKTTN